MKKLKKIFLFCLALLCFSITSFASITEYDCPHGDDSVYYHLFNPSNSMMHCVSGPFGATLTTRELSSTDVRLEFNSSTKVYIEWFSPTNKVVYPSSGASLKFDPNLDYYFYTNSDDFLKAVADYPNLKCDSLPPSVVPVVVDWEDFITLVVNNLGVLTIVGCLVLSLMLLPQLVIRLFRSLVG